MPMRRLMLGMAVTIGLLGIVPRVLATDLVPGGSVIPDTISSLPAGTVVASQSISLTSTSPSTFGVNLVSAVWQESATGHLDFVYQVTNTSPSGGDAINAANFSSFAGVKTDVSNLSPTVASGNGPLVGLRFNSAGTVSSNLTKRNSGPGNDSTVVFEGSSFVVGPGSVTGAPGQSSFLLTIKTDAIRFRTDGMALVSGASSGAFGSTFAPVAPVPEPASLLLLGSCFAGLGAGASWRRWRSRVANSHI
jgi:hypothetical protein